MLKKNKIIQKQPVANKNDPDTTAITKIQAIQQSNEKNNQQNKIIQEDENSQQINEDILILKRNINRNNIVLDDNINSKQPTNDFYKGPRYLFRL